MNLSNFYFPPPAPTCRYRIDPARRLRIEEYQGYVGLEDLRGTAEAISSDPSWSSDLHGLIDFSEARLDLTSNDILRFALLMRRDNYRTNGWMAFTVGDSAAFGMVRMLGHWARATDRTRIFHDRHEAEDWLEGRAGHVPPGFGGGLSDAYATPFRSVG